MIARAKKLASSTHGVDPTLKNMVDAIVIIFLCLQIKSNVSYVTDYVVAVLHIVINMPP